MAGCKRINEKNKILIILIMVIIISGSSSAEQRSVQLTTVLKDSIAPDSTEIRNLTSVELSQKMVPGWNLGNSLEAIGGETSWGNPPVSEELIESVKEAGFNAVRIPIAWSNGMDETTFQIDDELLYRVEEVIDYVIDNDMYAVINIHWDGGWMQPTYQDQDYVNHRMALLWHQIAVFFRDYDDHLLFAGTNEVHVEGDYGTPKPENYTVQNGFNQIFIKTVRSTGGANYYRHLVVQGYNTNIDHTLNYFVLPEDVVENRLHVEVHYYDPYNFTLNTNSTITQWGKDEADPLKTETWADESYADAQFNKMKTGFVDQGIGVILGEYSAMARTQLGSDALNEAHAAYRKYYHEYITGSICRHGLVPFYWDNGSTENFSSGLFDRASGEQAYPDQIQVIVEAARQHSNVVSNRADAGPDNLFLLQNYPNPFNPSTTLSFVLSQKARVSLKIFDVLGKEITTLVDAELPAGRHLHDWEAPDTTSGVYFGRLQVGNIVETRKLILQR